MLIGFGKRVKPLVLKSFTYVPGPAKIGFGKRSTGGIRLYDVLVDRATYKPNDMDGTTAARAVPPGKTPSLLETMGFKEDVCVQEYCDLMDAYKEGRINYDNYRSARARVGKLGSVSYSWKTWRD